MVELCGNDMKMVPCCHAGIWPLLVMLSCWALLMLCLLGCCPHGMIPSLLHMQGVHEEFWSGGCWTCAACLSAAPLTGSVGKVRLLLSP